MPCDLTLGRLEVCKDSVGGLKNVYFVNYGDATGYTYDATNTDVIDAVAGTPSAYKYELKVLLPLLKTLTAQERTVQRFLSKFWN